MHPYLADFEGPNGPIRIPTYGLVILAAFTAAFLLVHVRARRIGVDPDRLLPLYAAAGIGGMMGARLLYAVAVEPSATFAHPADVLASTGGFAFYGGVLGGAATVLGLASRMGLQGWKIADLAAPALALGLGIGRFACFFAGCCHGAPVSLDPSAVALVEPGGFLDGEIWVQRSFPFVVTAFGDRGVARITHVPLYPSQLWSAAAGIGVAVFLLVLSRRRRFDVRSPARTWSWSRSSGSWWSRSERTIAATP